MDKNIEKLPWKTEEEFYDLHSKEIFSTFPFYHVTMIGKTKEEFLQHIIKKARIIPNSKIVDLGCGSGYVVGALSDFCNCIGISTSKECIKQCKLNHPNSKFEIANMENYQCNSPSHFLALESIGYTNINTTFKNISTQLKTKGIFYIKETCIKSKENSEEKTNREHWENYWKYKGITVLQIIKTAYENGFKLIEFNDLSGKINNNMFIQSLKLNKVDYEMPYPEVNFLIPTEFVFVKL